MAVEDNNELINKWFLNSSNATNIYYENVPTTISVNISVTDLVTVQTPKVNSQNVFESKLMIPLYIIIFVLSVLGNSLVLVTLIRNKRMRTVTNVYLVNLAISDLLLGVFCMPITLVGQVLRNFIFGSAMCKLIPYFQAVSVSVAVWTLVAISLERYFAICRPLKSRRWQTQFHAYKMIGFVWLASLVWSGPILIVSTLQVAKRGHKCREVWPTHEGEQIYNLLLDVILLLIPMSIMSIAYFLIMNKLWKGLQREIQHNSSCQKLMFHKSGSSPAFHDDDCVRNNNTSSYSDDGLTTLRQSRLVSPPCNAKLLTTALKSSKKKNRDRNEAVKMWLMKGFVQVKIPVNAENQKVLNGKRVQSGVTNKLKTTNAAQELNCTEDSHQQESKKKNQDEGRAEDTACTFSRHAIRSNFMGKSIEAKKKVIRMLFVIVAEFFVCWAPLHILNTWYLFYPKEVYEYVGSTGISLVQLLAYISSCCNPITYCFMNRKFRQAFLTAFNCRYCCSAEPLLQNVTTCGNKSILMKINVNNSDVSCNDSAVYVGRTSTIGRSEVVVLEAEDRV